MTLKDLEEEWLWGRCNYSSYLPFFPSFCLPFVPLICLSFLLSSFYSHQPTSVRDSVKVLADPNPRLASDKFNGKNGRQSSMVILSLSAKQRFYQYYYYCKLQGNCFCLVNFMFVSTSKQVKYGTKMQGYLKKTIQSDI